MVWGWSQLRKIPSPASTPKVLFSTLPPPAADEAAAQNLVTIQSGGATVMALSHSYSANYSRSVKKEKERVVDNVRVKNKNDPAQFVDVERPKSITTSPTTTGPDQGSSDKTIYAKQPKADNVEVLEEDRKIKNPDYKG